MDAIDNLSGMETPANAAANAFLAPGLVRTPDGAYPSNTMSESGSARYHNRHLAAALSLPFAIGCAVQVEPDFTAWAQALDGGTFDAGFGLPPAVSSGGAGPFVPSTGGGMLPPFQSGGGAATPPPEQPGQTGCTPGTKRCGGLCVAPSPAIGCDLELCNPCPQSPANSAPYCQDGTCSWECNDGFVASADSCVAASPPSSGSGGSFTIPSTGGSPNAPTPPSTGSGSCSPSNCTGCSVVGPFGCCRNNGTCGCTWAPGAYCF